LALLSRAQHKYEYAGQACLVPYVLCWYYRFSHCTNFLCEILAALALLFFLLRFLTPRRTYFLLNFSYANPREAAHVLTTIDFEQLVLCVTLRILPHSADLLAGAATATERRMTTQEMLTQHKKLMDEAQRLEPSVMVTERNWSALLEMQDRLFRQQMQLDTDLKMLLTKAEAQESLTAMQVSTTEFAGQAGNLSVRYSSACKELTESTKTALNTVTKETNQRLSNMTQAAKKKICLCAWISITAIILCAALCALAVLWSR